MLNQVLIKKIAEELKIAPLNIIREYYEIEVLHHLSQSKLAKSLIFYGGTALRLAYHSFRFSEDLDFLLEKPAKDDLLELRIAVQRVEQENPDLKVEEVIEKRQTIFALLHIKNKLLKHPIRIKIEISKKKNGLRKENLLLISPTSNKEIIFPTATAESIYNLKEKAIFGRNLPRDWFDFWYLSQKLRREEKVKKTFPFAASEFSRELKRWLPSDKWLIIPTVIKFYHENKN